MKKQITVQVVIEVELIDGEKFEVATGRVLGTGVRGLCTVIGGGVDTETKAAEAARGAVRKYRDIIGDNLTEELTRHTVRKLRAVPESPPDLGEAPELGPLNGSIAGR